MDGVPELTCPICLGVLTAPYTTHCGHSFCKECIVQHIQTVSEQRAVACPLCRADLSPCENPECPVCSILPLERNLNMELIETESSMLLVGLSVFGCCILVLVLMMLLRMEMSHRHTDSAVHNEDDTYRNDD